MENLFKFSQDVLIEHSGTMIGHLATDLPDFTNFDADLNETKRDAMEALIEWFLQEGGDVTEVAGLKGATSTLLEKLAASRKIYHQLRYWVMKTFPNEKAIQRKFGIGRFAKVADNQSEMVVFMGALAQHVATHRSALEGTGAPVALLDEVKPHADALRAANEAQEIKKGSRQVNTSQRTAKLNELYQHTRDFNMAAEFVYYDDSAKRDLYRPPSNTNAAEEIEEEEPIG